jgi:Na+-translocating ferredoxin:NAD+ oxidoreductase subunit G
MAAPEAHGALRTLLMVGAVAVGAALLVTVSHELSRERIEANQRMRLERSLHTVLPPELHDNELGATRLEANDPLLGTTGGVDIYVATMDSRPVAAIFTTVAPDGYTGPIRLMIGVLADGTVSGVRVLSHRETPGLGDAIEISKSPWMTQFDGTRLDAPARDDWAVDRDGGAFDSITGATITARAVVKAVANTLLYFERHAEELFEAAGELHAEDEREENDESAGL